MIIIIIVVVVVVVDIYFDCCTHSPTHSITHSLTHSPTHPLVLSHIISVLSTHCTSIEDDNGKMKFIITDEKGQPCFLMSLGSMEVTIPPEVKFLKEKKNPFLRICVCVCVCVCAVRVCVCVCGCLFVCYHRVPWR